jgi:CheY-like chemotaxis protein
LVHLHGGTVRAESRGEGLGATFTVHLPDGLVPAVATRPTTGGPQAIALDGARVLVVDDDPDTREVLRTILEDAGASVTVTGSAQETRTALRLSQPDVLIADIGMPGEDGYSLMKSIRTYESGDARLPAVALTAHAGPQDVERALASGFQLHMAKPIDAARLIAGIARLVQAPGIVHVDCPVETR